MEELRAIVLYQPSIYVFGVRIDEPVTTITDLLVSAICLLAYYRLKRAALPGKTQSFLRFYFMLMGVATLFGGLIGHAFLYLFVFAWKLPGWIFSMLSVALIERASIGHAQPFLKPQIGKFFLGLNIVELLTVGTVTISTLDFKWVEFHTGYGLLAIVLPFHSYVYYKTRDKGSFTFIIAVGIASLGALVFMNKISLNTWFNHLDFSHMLLAIAAWVFYKGTIQLKHNF
jgi:hypothetical protein